MAQKKNADLNRRRATNPGRRRPDETKVARSTSIHDLRGNTR
jgi:hypothetical protein